MLHWKHGVQVQCDYCGLCPVSLIGWSWDEAAASAAAAYWWVDKGGGECACPSCRATMLTDPAPDPDHVVQLTDPLPGEEATHG